MGAGKTVEARDEWTARMKARHKNGNGHGKSLSIEVRRPDEDWAQYQQALERHAALVGRDAPERAVTDPDGRGWVTTEFVEWMMGLPAGHVTDPAIWEGFQKRNQIADATDIRRRQLKVLGNGVVPQQAKAAVQTLLDRLERRAS